MRLTWYLASLRSNVAKAEAANSHCRRSCKQGHELEALLLWCSLARLKRKLVEWGETSSQQAQLADRGGGN